MDFHRLCVNDVSRHFGRRRALSRVSCTFEAGQIAGLLGPNGSGKSTLLSILATVVTASAGEVRYGDRTAQEHGGELRGRIGLLGHELYLYPELSGRENLEFFGRIYAVPNLATRIDRALAAAGLLDRAADPVAALSRGLRQRLALERALLHDPRLVLMDEPFTGLDERSAGTLLDRLRGLRDQGRIVVVATHDLDLVDGLLDRVVFLQQGRVLAVENSGISLRSRYREHVAAGVRGRGSGL